MYHYVIYVCAFDSLNELRLQIAVLSVYISVQSHTHTHMDYFEDVDGDDNKSIKIYANRFVNPVVN